MTYSTISHGLNILADKPVSPKAGDAYIDRHTYDGFVFDGTNWVQISGSGPSPPIKSLEPTKEELETHPTLKSAWEEYVVVRRLLGI